MISYTAFNQQMEIDNQDTNDDPVDIKLRELKHLIGDYDARTFENIPEDYVYSLINIIKILEYLISNEYFRFNYRNNQVKYDCFILS